MSDSEPFPSELQRALRATRTPLIEGVDFKPAQARRDALLPDESHLGAFPLEKSRVDTLSPKESVPPPAPYPAEPPPPRPSIVPPVRRPYGDPQSPRPRSEAFSSGLRSDPPPRIPISDRPSRPAYRSDPPPRLSRSDPPPQSSGRGATGQRYSWAGGVYGVGEAVADSAEARRREAVTIPADAHSPSQAPAYDPSMPIPALRAPSFPASHLPNSMRQHENSRLRNVAFAMMFVICIVTGAIAGMRWYVGHDEAVRTNRDVVAETVGPRTPKLKLDRLEPNAVVAPRDPSVTVIAPAAAPEGSEQRRASTGAANAIAKDSTSEEEPEPTQARSPVDVQSPWNAAETSADPSAPPTEARAVSRPNTPKRRPQQKPKPGTLDPSQVDTKTPLIMD